MWVAPLCIDMYEGRTRVASKYSTAEHTEQRTLGGLVAYLLTVPALVAVVVAPTVVFGVMLGVAGLALGERAVRRLAEDGHSSPSVTSGRPA